MNEQLDQDVVNLTKAIRQVESNKNPTARGASGEFGYYQFMPSTWAETTKKYKGAPVPIEQATPELQNEVAYRQVKEWKDAGYNPGQIASMWNAGASKPNAYKEGWRGVNEYGVEYDTPAYAEKVAREYQAIKQGTAGGVQRGVIPAAQAAAPEIQPQAPKKDFLQAATDVVTSIFPGKQVGEAIGTLGGYLAAPKENKEFYDTSAPSPLQVAGDVAQGALTVGAGLPGRVASLGVFGTKVPVMRPAGGLVGRMIQNTALGAGIGGTGAIAAGDSAPEVLTDIGIGAIAGGAIGGMGEVVRAAANYLPKRVVSGTIKGLNEETAKYAADRKLGSPTRMLVQSDAELKSLGDRLGAALTKSGTENIRVNGTEVFDEVAKAFPDSGLTGAEVADNIKRLVPLKKTLVDKVIRGEANLKELHQMNSALGRTVFKSVFDDPAVKAGKEVGSEAYHTISRIIKDAAPGSEEIFENLSREIQLNKALNKAVDRGMKSSLFTLKDLVALSTGLHMGPMGALGGFIAGKAASSPAFKLNAAQSLSSLGSGEPVKQLAPLITGGIERGGN